MLSITTASTTVRKSDNRAKQFRACLWFMMIICIPLLSNIFFKKFFKNNHENDSSVVLYLYYASVIFIGWIAPLYLAEMLAANEAKFRERINDFCPGNMQTRLNNRNVRASTFASRKNVQLLLSYLDRKQPGLLVGGYNFQLKLSFLSFYVAMIGFVINFFGK